MMIKLLLIDLINFLLQLEKQHIKKSNSLLMSEVMLQHSKPAAQNFQEQSNLFLPKKAGCTLFGC